jgi:SAM-dependent methyltransferase
MSLNNTVKYYDSSADDFYNQTVDVDMGPLYDKFLPYINCGGHILDAGCGSGRDAKAFLDRGFEVTAFDASESLAAKASVFLGRKVVCCSFEDIEVVEKFDGVWACASLLHVPEDNLSSVIQKLGDSLKPRGIMYASFKKGAGERMDSKGRQFTDINPHRLNEIMSNNFGLQMLETWETSDRRPGRGEETWCNFIFEKIRFPSHSGGTTK